MKMKMLIQNKETFKRVLFWSSMVICLLLIGCRDKSDAYFNRAYAHYEKGEYDLAISDFNKAIEINPRFVDAYFNRGIAYAQKGEYDLAISDYNKAIEINPRYAPAYNNRGVAYYHKGEYDKAWEDVYKAQSLGLQVYPGFLKKLREASGRDR